MKRGFLLTVRVLFVIYMASVCCLCFLNCSFSEELELPAVVWGIPIDKVVHFIMFLPFPILAIPTFNLSEKNTALSIRRCLFIIFAGIIFAAATELIQKYFLVGRDGDPADFAADIIGMAAGLILFVICCLPIIRKLF